VVSVSAETNPRPRAFSIQACGYRLCFCPGPEKSIGAPNAGFGEVVQGYARRQVVELMKSRPRVRGIH